MADQLSLRLEADQLPELPDLRPMLPRPLPAPFDSDEHLFEPWWGGERALVSIGPAELPGGGCGGVRDAEGRDLTAALPELAGLAVRVAARSAVLDGELVVVDAPAAPMGRSWPAGRWRGTSGGVPRLRPAPPRWPVAAVAAARPPAGGAPQGAPAGRRGGRGAGHRDRGHRPVRGGRRPGDRRDPRPSARRARTCPASAAGCGATWPPSRSRAARSNPMATSTPRALRPHRSSRSSAGSRSTRSDSATRSVGRPIFPGVLSRGDAGPHRGQDRRSHAPGDACRARSAWSRWPSRARSLPDKTAGNDEERIERGRSSPSRRAAARAGRPRRPTRPRSR